MASTEIFLILAFLLPVWTLPLEIPIGGIFDSDDRALMEAFMSAVNRVNNRNTLRGSRLASHVHKISANNSLIASNTVCSLMSNGVAAIIGPQSRDSSSHVESMCQAFEVPHLVTSWNWEEETGVSINLFPHGPTLVKSYLDLTRLWNWTTFVIIYQHNDALVKLKDLFESPRKLPFKIKAVQLPAVGNYYSVLSDVKKAGYMNFVVDCETDKIYTVLKQAQQVGLMTDKFHYLITNLDLDTVVLEEFQYSGANITSVRLVNPSLVKTANASNYDFVLKTETALIYDAVNMLAKALADLDASHSIKLKPLICQSNIENDPWVQGQILINYIKLIQENGLSGLVELDSNGYRTKFSLDITELQIGGLQKIGSWSSDNGLNISRPKYDQDVDDGTIKGKFFHITTILSAPYVMYRTSQNLTGNAQFEGFCIDMLEELSKSLQFSYSLDLVPDQVYGKKDEKGNWNGLIGQLQQRRTDLAVGDITATSIREQVVDFSSPYLHLGISLLFRRPIPTSGVRSFLSPFSTFTWTCIVVTFIVVSCFTFIIARLTPYEWRNPTPSITETPDELVNHFTLLNSFWFAVSSLAKSQSSDTTPKAGSTRIIAACWWFFALIVMSTYTAKLAASLVNQKLRMELPIKDISDLVRQTDIKYGCLDSGSTMAFFRDSKNYLFNEIWANMILSEPSVFVKNNYEGIQRVKRGGYAFFIESTSAEYVEERDCDIMKIGEVLQNRGYAIGLPKGSPYRDMFSAAILKLHEKGVVHKLKMKWWKHKKGDVVCETSDEITVEALGMSTLGGLFWALLAGTVLAIIIAILELWWRARQMLKSDGESTARVMLNELAEAFSLSGSKTVPERHLQEEEQILSSSRISLNFDS